MLTIKGKKYESFQEEHARNLKDPEFRKLWEADAPRRALVSLLIDLRNEGEITQRELAAALKTKQPSIARFESRGYSPSLQFAQRVAMMVGKTFVLRDLPPGQKTPLRKRRRKKRS